MNIHLKVFFNLFLYEMKCLFQFLGDEHLGKFLYWKSLQTRGWILAGAGQRLHREPLKPTQSFDNDGLRSRWKWRMDE